MPGIPVDTGEFTNKEIQSPTIILFTDKLLPPLLTHISFLVTFNVKTTSPDKESDKYMIPFAYSLT